MSSNRRPGAAVGLSPVGKHSAAAQQQSLSNAGDNVHPSVPKLQMNHECANLTPLPTGSTMSKDDIISVNYEISGKVQGVFFRKYTQAEGKKLGLVGWVRNTDTGNVQGQLQGPRSKVEKMQEWLKSTGSPKSHITKAEFKNKKTIDSLQHNSFNIVK